MAIGDKKISAAKSRPPNSNRLSCLLLDSWILRTCCGLIRGNFGGAETSLGVMFFAKSQGQFRGSLYPFAQLTGNRLDLTRCRHGGHEERLRRVFAESRRLRRAAWQFKPNPEVTSDLCQGQCSVYDSSSNCHQLTRTYLTMV